MDECDNESFASPLKIIRSESDMVDFVDRVKDMFDCPESYEYYFGFERKWDDETGEILETAKEYYDRGGIFSNIPEKYPCVIYFGMADFEYGMNIRKLHWIFIGK